MRTGHIVGNTLLAITATIGTLAGRAVSYLVQHPRIVAFLATMGISGFMAWLIVGLALLVNPMRGLFVMLYLVMAPAAVFTVGSDRVLSRRLWIAMLASVMGLLSFRVIYWDLLHLELDPIFRSNLIGIFGLVCGVTGFLKVR